jgi:AraC-like DNA-binding protein
MRLFPDSTVPIRSFGVTFRSGQATPAALHVTADWHQLIYATRGVMTVYTDEGAWVVPPHRGVWIPAGFRYRLEMSGEVALRMLYVRAGSRRASRICSVVNVTPLLRELIVRTNLIGALDTGIPEQSRLIGVILDELKVLTSVPLQLPLPQDARAAQFAALAAAETGGKLPMAKMLRRSGASRRTLERIFRAETAMSLGQWLRRQKLLHALRLLAAGEGVNTIALELGYNSASAFIAMFRRELGQTPTRYFENQADLRPLIADCRIMPSNYRSLMRCRQRLSKLMLLLGKANSQREMTHHAGELCRASSVIREEFHGLRIERVFFTFDSVLSVGDEECAED